MVVVVVVVVVVVGGVVVVVVVVVAVAVAAAGAAAAVAVAVAVGVGVVVVVAGVVVVVEVIKYFAIINSKQTSRSHFTPRLNAPNTGPRSKTKRSTVTLLLCSSQLDTCYGNLWDLNSTHCLGYHIYSNVILYIYIICINYIYIHPISERILKLLNHLKPPSVDGYPPI